LIDNTLSLSTIIIIIIIIIVAAAAASPRPPSLRMLRGSFPVFAGDEKYVNFLAWSVCLEMANNIARGAVCSISQS